MLIHNSPRPRQEPLIATFVPEAPSAQLFQAAQPRHLKAGEQLFAIGDPGDDCFLLEQGLLKATVASPLGEERIIAILGPGAIVGELSMIDGLPRSASIVAMRDCVLRFVSRQAFRRRANSETHQVLLAILATQLRQAHEDLAATTFLTVKARVARALLKLAEYIGQPSSQGHIVFQDRIILADLAAMAGVARENASRVLSEWRRRKFVTGSSHRLCLNNIAAIEREMDLNDGAREQAGVVAVGRADEYRLRARQCLELAAADRDARVTLFYMAKAWLRLAKRDDLSPVKKLV
jgi:CRP/FNR family cyclic AMP-dependent transcriptional regulator